MYHSQRDAEIIQLVATFRQLSGLQIGRLVFHGCKSDTSRDVVLRRLVKTKQLAYTTERIATGKGSAPYVYQLGSRSWGEYSDKGYPGRQGTRMHAVSVGETFALLVEAERSGLLKIESADYSPGIFFESGRGQVEPDGFAHVVRPDGTDTRLWLEVDMCTEKEAVLIGKLERYWHAHQAGTLGESPLVVFPVSHKFGDGDRVARRVRFLQNAVHGGPEEAWGLFRVVKLEGLVESF